MAIGVSMDIEGEIFDDEINFMEIVPSFLTPQSLTRFHLYEKLESSGEKGIYRFRCLLKDIGSIPETTLAKMLRSWDSLFIHKREIADYDNYLKDNLHLILANKGVSIEKRARLFTDICSDVIQDVLTQNLGFPQLLPETLASLQSLVSKAIGFISDVHSLKGLAKLIGHDYETHTHSVKVGWLMATFVNANRDLFDDFGKSDIDKLLVDAAVMGFLHDIGKSNIPKQIINKKGQLDNIEYVAIQAHTAYAVSLLFDSGLPKYMMEGILYHHENEDGSGYPCGLKGDDIPVLPKICHMIDVFDALTSERPYKPPKTPYQALALMVGKNPNLETLQKMEKELWSNSDAPVSVVVRNEKNPDINRIKRESRMNAESEKCVEARMKLRDNGMAHCFNAELLKRFIRLLSILYR